MVKESEHDMWMMVGDLKKELEQVTSPSFVGKLHACNICDKLSQS